MSVKRIATRYAKSLLDLSVEQNKVERVLEDIQAFNKVAKLRDFYLMIKSPIIKPDKKKKILESIFSGKFDELTMAFLNIVLRKGRESNLPEICTEFTEQYKELKEITTVKVTSAVPLTEAALEQIKTKLAKSDATRANIELETEVDKDLIGGFKLEFGDKLYDASVRYQLNLLGKELAGNKYLKN